LRAARAARIVQPIGSNAVGGQLRLQLESPRDVAERANWARSADRNHVRPVAACGELRGDFGDSYRFVRRDRQMRSVARRNEMNRRAEQAIEEQVALNVGMFVA